jgi:hypothetical protein
MDEAERSSGSGMRAAYRPIPAVRQFSTGVRADGLRAPLLGTLGG